MKKITFSILIAAALLNSLTSCRTDVEPGSEIASETYWKTENDAFLALNSCYSALPGFDILDEMATDNAHSHKPWEGPMELVQMNGISNADYFGYDFSDIRKFNIFIENVGRISSTPEMIERMKSEARVLRAFSYLNLTSKFGKVPIITTVLDYNAPLLKRNEVAEVRKFILDELQAASEKLPVSYSGGKLNEEGRITKGAALAIRARAALYFGNYAEAEKSAKAVMDLGKYRLFTLSSLNDQQKKEAAEMDQYIDFADKGIDRNKFILGMFSYEAMFHKAYANPFNPEYVLTREFSDNEKTMDWTRYIYIRPSQLVKGYSSFEPMQDLVDAYWDVDGKSKRTVDPAARAASFAQLNAKVANLGQQAYIQKVPTMDLRNEPYMQEFRNRDARLYASILFPFKGWHETDFGTFYYRWDPAWAGNDGNESWTGYSYRKLVSLTPFLDENSAEDYPLIRYAEVLLTFAEAHIQNSGWDSQAQAAVNQLRDRLGMPKVPASLSKSEALDFVRNERRIELAAEGQRWEDIRRYGSAYAAKVMTGATLAPNGYQVVDKQWNDRLMLMPIHQGAIDLNPNLASDQNPGY